MQTQMRFRVYYALVPPNPWGCLILTFTAGYTLGDPRRGKGVGQQREVRSSVAGDISVVFMGRAGEAGNRLGISYFESFQQALTIRILLGFVIPGFGVTRAGVRLNLKARGERLLGMWT